MKLARRLILALIAVQVLILGAHAYVRVRRELDLFEDDMRRDAEIMGRAVGAAMVDVWRHDGEQRAMQVVADANLREGQVQIRWVWLDGAAPDPHRPLVPSSAARPDGSARVPSHRVNGEEGEDLFVTYVPVATPGARPGALEFAESLARERAYIRRTLINSVIATLLVAAVCGGVTGALGLWFVGRPMRRLMDQARRVGAGQLDARLDVRQRDEIGELAREMNAMCDRLEAANEKIRVEMAARSAAEAQLRHADRLATVGTLAAGIAHELGTPLQVISGRARMLVDGDVAPEDVSENGRILLEHARRMTGTIRHLLDFARPRPPQRVKTDLSQIVRSSVTLVRTIAEKRRIELRLEVSDEHLLAEVDAEQIQQALVNLLVNGIQAMPSGGILIAGALSAAPGGAPASANGSSACLYVADQGEGMTPDVAERVFEPFFTTKSVGEGTGLGLSIAYGIVREHGGRIDLETAPGRGSRFRVYLPRSQHA